MADVKINAQGSDLHGGTLVNAATEETLAEMRDAIKKMARDKGLDTKQANKKVKEFTDAVEDSTDEQIDLSKATGVASKGFGTASKAMSKFGEIAHKNANISASLPGPLKGMASGLTGVLKWLGPVGTGFAALTGIIGAYIAYTNQLIDDWIELSSTGTTFGGSMHEARQAALGLGLSTQQLTKIVRDGSVQFANAFGNASEGAMRFAEIGDVMRRRFGLELRSLGITAEEAAGYLKDYIGMNQLNDSFRRQSTLQQAEAAKNLVTEMDLLAKITGESREKQMEELNKAVNRDDFQAALMDMTDDQRRAAERALALAQRAGPQAADSFIAEFLGRAPLDKATQMWEVAMGDTADVVKGLARDAKAGNVDFVQGIKDLAGTMDSVDAVFAEVGQYSQVSGAAGEMAKAAAETKRALTGLATAVELAEEENITVEQALKRLAETADDTEGGLKMREALNQLQDTLLDALDNIVQAFNKKLLPVIEDNLVPMLKDWVESIDPEAVGEFVSSTLTKMGKIFEVFGALIERIAGWFDIDIRSEAEKVKDSISELGNELSTDYLFGSREEDQEKLRQQLQRMAEIDPSKAQEAFNELYENFKKHRTMGQEVTPETQRRIREEFIERYGMTPSAGPHPTMSPQWAEPITPPQPNVASPTASEEESTQPKPKGRGTTPEFQEGGVSRGPESGYSAKLHGTEAVVPLPDGKRIPVEQIGQDQAQMAFEKMVEKLNVAIREIQESNKHLKNIAQLSS